MVKRRMGGECAASASRGGWDNGVSERNRNDIRNGWCITWEVGWSAG